MHAGFLEYPDLFRGERRHPRDDRPGVSHALAGRRRLADDRAHYRLRDVILDELGGLLLLGPADLADHHDRVRLVGVLEHPKHVDKSCAVQRVAADADACRLADAELR